MIITPADVNDLQGGSLINVGSITLVSATSKYTSVQGVGTAYTLTTSAAAVAFGTTSPAIVLPSTGVWKISGQIQLDRAGMTITNQTASLMFHRTNNTGADLGSTVTIDLPVSTTLTDTLGIYTIPEYFYQSAGASDAITIYAAISGALGAGTLTAVALGSVISATKVN